MCVCVRFLSCFVCEWIVTEAASSIACLTGAEGLWATQDRGRKRKKSFKKKPVFRALKEKNSSFFSVSFNIGETGNVVCPQGTSLVTDVNVCRDSVAISLGGTFVMCTSAGWGGCTTAAIGCFKHSTNRILFQSDGTKVRTANSYAPICKRGNISFQLLTECEAFSRLRDWYLF